MSTNNFFRVVWHPLTNPHPDLPGLPEPDEVNTVTAGDGGELFVRSFYSDATPHPQHQPAKVRATVVFAHGFNLSGESWFFQVERLKKEPGLRMIVPDMRGHGRSVEQPGDREIEDLTIPATSRDIITIIEQLAPEGPLILVGHSMGVMTMLGAVRMMPEEMRERVKGMMLLNGAISTFASAGLTTMLNSLPVRSLRYAWKATPKGMEKLKDSFEWLLKPVLASGVYHGKLEEGASAQFDVVDFHAAEIERTPMSTILGFADDLAEHDETDAADYLGSIRGVLMAGEKDDVTPVEQTRTIAKMWPGSSSETIPEAGHMLPVECPEAVNTQLIRLIDESCPR
ncbi:alpha/beta fold hydrolase [Corynebacterium falsenii]